MLRQILRGKTGVQFAAAFAQRRDGSLARLTESAETAAIELNRESIT
jgi:hypothetical protein